uniref:Uncharacterized protein n=1 Tax=Myotis myotis TaxID=51298 RepID=A0A7J7VYS6_MYOMY|nr:hypothetical protein mMyoMyo1_012377 [Myotis myotis]
MDIQDKTHPSSVRLVYHRKKHRDLAVGRAPVASQAENASLDASPSSASPPSAHPEPGAATWWPQRITAPLPTDQRQPLRNHRFQAERDPWPPPVHSHLRSGAGEARVACRGHSPNERDACGKLLLAQLFLRMLKIWWGFFVRYFCC